MPYDSHINLENRHPKDLGLENSFKLFSSQHKELLNTEISPGRLNKQPLYTM